MKSAKNKQPALPDGVIEGAKLIFELTGLSGYRLAVAMDKVYSSYTGKSALEIAGFMTEEDF